SGVSKLKFDDDWKGTAKDLERLEDLYDLVEITFIGERVTDDFLKPLAQIKTLQAVTIIKAKVTDEGIQSLNQLPLVRLTVRYTPVSDKSIATFKTLNKLRMLQLFGTDVKAEPEELKAILTSVEIDHRKGGFLGVGPSLNLGAINGCRINEPQDRSAAMNAGFKENDIIVKYNDKPVTDFESLRALIAENHVGDKIPVELKRGNETLKKTVTLGEWPPVP
ncbi:MAG: PDZ domain-containing protein, partial [Planctomycetota bacterium]